MKKPVLLLSIILLAILSFFVYNKIVNNLPSFDQENQNNNDYIDWSTENEVNNDREDISLPNDEIFEEYERLFRVDQQGEVVVGVTYLNPVENDDDYLNFEIAMDTHSVNLDLYDLSTMIKLNVGNQLVIKENINWEVLSGGGHHVYGIVRVSKSSLQELDYKNIEFIEMEIMDLDNIKSRKFRWDMKDF